MLLANIYVYKNNPWLTSAIDCGDPPLAAVTVTKPTWCPNHTCHQEGHCIAGLPNQSKIHPQNNPQANIFGLPGSETIMSIKVHITNVRGGKYLPVCPRHQTRFIPSEISTDLKPKTSKKYQLSIPHIGAPSFYQENISRTHKISVKNRVSKRAYHTSWVPWQPPLGNGETPSSTQARMPSLAPLPCRSARFPHSKIPSALQWRHCKKLSVAFLLASQFLPQTLISRHEESSQKPGPSDLWERNILVFFLQKGPDHWPLRWNILIIFLKP